MSGNNGKATAEMLRSIVAEKTNTRMGQDEPAPIAPPAAVKPINPALALLPFTAVPFEGPNALYAWGRLILYGGLAVVLYEKRRKASYVMIGAAGLSVLTSLAYQASSKG